MTTVRPSVDLQVLQQTLDDAGAIGFVSVATGREATLRYLTRTRLDPDAEYAFVFADGRSVLCSPSHAVPSETFDGTVRVDDGPAGVRAGTVLDELSDGSGVVLTSRRIPHDAALHLERGGYELASTRVLSEARATKAPAERDCIERVQRAAVGALRRAATVLADATISPNDELVVDGRTLTDERLRREVNVALARAGVTDAENTVVTAGAIESERGADTSAGEELELPLRRGETVTVAVTPRGRSGYHSACARTFVVDSDGGWERRASVAVESAYDVAVSEIEPGVSLGHVREELLAELASYGFDPGDYPPESVCYGIGLEPHEGPDGADELRPGMTLVVDARVRESSSGLVRVGSPVVVTESGCESLGDSEFTRTLVPERY